MIQNVSTFVSGKDSGGRDSSQSRGGRGGGGGGGGGGDDSRGDRGRGGRDEGRGGSNRCEIHLKNIQICMQKNTWFRLRDSHPVAYAIHAT